MKRVIAVLIAMIMLFSFAYAEDADTFITLWNYWGGIYSSVQLSQDNAKIESAEWIFSGDGWKVIVKLSGGKYKTIGIYAEDFETFISNAATMGMVVVGDTTDFSNYLGYLVRMYFDAKAGEDVIPFVYGSFTYMVTKSTDGYLMTFSEL